MTATAIDYQALGFTQEELQERVVQRIADSLLNSEHGDDEGRGYRTDSEFKKKLDEKIREGIDAAVVRVADAHVLPNVIALVEGAVLQETNKWGEKRGEPKTFIEYLTERADAYIREPVDYQGKPKSGDSYNWRANGTRIAYMIDQHLQYQISTAMEGAVKSANESIKGGILEAVKIALGQIQAGLKLSVEVKK